MGNGAAKEANRPRELPGPDAAEDSVRSPRRPRPSGTRGGMPSDLQLVAMSASGQGSEGGNSGISDPATFDDPIQLKSTDLPDLIPDYYHFPPRREDWKKLPVKYDYDESGEPTTMRVGENIVMMRFEKPVAERTIQVLSHEIRTHLPRILLGGEGLGYTTLESLRVLRDRGGGILHIVELHPDIIAAGQKRISRFWQEELMPEQREGLEIHEHSWEEEKTYIAEASDSNPKLRIDVVWHQGDFRDVVKTFPNDYFDIAHVDLFPLEPDEIEVDSFVHTDEIVRILKPTGAFSPYSGQEIEPLDKQAAYVKNKFLESNRTHVWTNAPRDCPYFKGSRMAVDVWRSPIKAMQPNIPVSFY